MPGYPHTYASAPRVSSPAPVASDPPGRQRRAVGDVGVGCIARWSRGWCIRVGVWVRVHGKAEPQEDAHVRARRHRSYAEEHDGKHGRGQPTARCTLRGSGGPPIVHFFVFASTSPERHRTLQLHPASETHQRPSGCGRRVCGPITRASARQRDAAMGAPPGEWAPEQPPRRAHEGILQQRELASRGAPFRRRQCWGACYSGSDCG